MWQPPSPTRASKTEFLRRVMVRLGAGGKASSSPRAAVAPAQFRAELKKKAATAIAAEGLRAFRPGLAARRPGARPRRLYRRGPRPAEGLYFVRYADPEAEMERRTATAASSRGYSLGRSQDKAEHFALEVKQDRTAACQCAQQGRRDGRLAYRAAHPPLLHEQLK